MPPTEQARQHAKALRQTLTPAERLLWSRVRNRQLGSLKIRRQQPIGPYIADFFCAGHCLVIELDGHSHDEQVEHDMARTTWLQSEGYRVLRFTNSEVMTNVEGVLSAIVVAVGQSPSP